MKYVIGGVLLLAVAMGVGRFAYTPLLPLMQADLQWTNSTAGFIALSNYTGYFVGALLCTFFTISNKRFVLLWMIWVSAISILLVGFTDNVLLIFGGRFISGLASAVIFIFTSQIVLTYIQSIQKNSYTGFLYSGVGIGIVGSSLLIMLFSAIFTWSEQWQLLGVVSLVLGLIGYAIIRMLPSDLSAPVVKNVQLKRTIYWFYFAYF